MKLFYAHYPSLEKSFLQFVTQNRAALEPWLVVCASSGIAHRLATRLARAQGAVANIHFCTASSLLYRLDSEAGPALPVFPQDHLRDFLIKEILTEPGLDIYPISRGFVGAVKSALRDLADSLATPETLEEILPNPDEEDEKKIQAYKQFAWFVRVYKRYCEREAQLPGFRPYQALFERALSHVETSSYLKQFSNIILYGFYDMPGRMLDFLSRIRSQYTGALFVPYGKFPAYQFAQKFFETNYLGASRGGTDENTDDFGALGPHGDYLFAPQGSSKMSAVHIVSAANVQSEVRYVAKEILRLVEEEHLSFSDIGVLARSVSPYQQEVRRLFAQNKIALNASFTYSWDRCALGVFCLNLLTLAENGFDRESVLAILSSPYFSHKKKWAWRKLVEKSLVSLNISQWRDLLPNMDGYDPEFLTWLENCRTRLESLDLPGLWTDKCAQVTQFLAENIDVGALTGSETGIYQQLCTCVLSLAQYGMVRPSCQAGEFIRELTQALSGLTFTEVENAPRGVVFMDVLRARGLQFKVVFLLGVNEKIFPQIVPEDPIFRDKFRYLVRDGLGCWVTAQAERTAEERLLFFTACSSATEKLYVSYAGRGNDNKELVPSVYVAELARVSENTTWKADPKAAPQVSALIGEQITSVNPLLLTPKEVAAAIMLSGEPQQIHWEQAGLSSPDTPRQLAAVHALKSWGAAGIYDGYISGGEQIFAHHQAYGFSPSALQTLANCPLKYFFSKIIGLTEDSLLFRDQLAANTRGNMYHEVLEHFYQRLLQLGITHDVFDSGVEKYIDETAQTVLPQSYQPLGLYPVIWEMLREEITNLLKDFARKDVAALGPFTPTYFEQEFPPVSIEGFPFRLHGKIDRIDIDNEGKQFRVIDYKSSKKGTADLIATFFKERIFQPFLYVLAAGQLKQLNGYTSAGSYLLSFKDGSSVGYKVQRLSAEEWQAMYPKALALFNLLAQFIQQGTLILRTSDECKYCPYDRICRRDSFACLMRARRSTPSKALEEICYVPPKPKKSK